MESQKLSLEKQRIMGAAKGKDRKQETPFKGHQFSVMRRSIVITDNNNIV